MKKFIIALLSIFIFSFIHASETVVAFRILGFGLDGKIQKADTTAINLAWIEVKGDNMFFSGSYADLADIKISNLHYKGEMENSDRIFTADIVDGPGELMIVLPAEAGRLCSVAFIDTPRPFNLLLAPYNDLKESFHNLLFLEMSQNEKAKKETALSLESNYREIKSQLQDIVRNRQY